MVKGRLVAIAAAVGMSVASSVSASAQAKTGYASVNGLEMYYEIHGAGRPMVLLHGALMTIEQFQQLLPSLAKTRQVIAIEQQAHGRTADADRPFRYEQMADDTAALLRHLELGQADVFGYSMGGGIALQLAIRHPELVRKLVIAAPAYGPDGFYPEVLENIRNLKPEDFEGSPWLDAYASVAPDPEGWPTLLGKVRELVGEFEGWPAEDIRAIEAPALGLTPMIIQFLDAPMPEAK
jgi:pimeloyl-ACP methyl ester carboxylesterase